MPRTASHSPISRRAAMAGAAAFPAIALPAAAAACPAPYIMSARTRRLLDLIERQQADIDREIPLEGLPGYDAACAATEASWAELEPLAEAVTEAPTRTFDDAVAKALVARHHNAGKKWQGFDVGWEDGSRASAAAALAILNLAGLDCTEALS